MCWTALWPSLTVWVVWSPNPKPCGARLTSTRCALAKSVSSDCYAVLRQWVGGLVSEGPSTGVTPATLLLPVLHRIECA